MSEDSGIGSFFGGSIRLVIFIVLLIVASPFLAVGYYKNSQIQSSMDAGVKFIQTQKYVQAQEKFESAADQLGILYDCYVIALPIVGGKYYEKKVVYGLRGVARGLAIGERMGEGNFAVTELINEADKDITNRGNFPESLKSLKELGEVSLKAYRQLMPIYDNCNKSHYDLAFKDLKSMLDASPYVKFDAIGLPICYLLHQIAINLKSKAAITLAQTYILAMAQENAHPLFQKFSMQISSIVPPSDQPRQVASAKPQNLKEKYQLGIAHAKRKDFAKAAPILEECYSAEPRNDVIVYALALVKRQMGQNKEAKKLCEAILQRKPGDEKAGKLLAALSK